MGKINVLYLSDQETRKIHGETAKWTSDIDHAVNRHNLNGRLFRFAEADEVYLFEQEGCYSKQSESKVPTYDANFVWWYLCDRKACENCNKGCSYTKDIKHAVNRYDLHGRYFLFVEGNLAWGPDYDEFIFLLEQENMYGKSHRMKAPRIVRSSIQKRDMKPDRVYKIRRCKPKEIE